MALYPSALSRAARGEHVPNLPRVVHRNMQLPKEERADFRQRLVEPFEVSYFRSRCAALKHRPGGTPWWEWLAGDGIARALFDAMAGGDELAAAPAKLRSCCMALLDTWLLQGALDEFSALRAELAALEEAAGGRAVTLTELHAREADALEHKFSTDWLLVVLLDTLIPALRRAGVVAARPPRRPCPACLTTYDPTVPARVALVCFLPCCHWVCYACFERDRSCKAKRGQPPRCVECNVEALPMQREWPGGMI